MMIRVWFGRHLLQLAHSEDDLHESHCACTYCGMPKATAERIDDSSKIRLNMSRPRDVGCADIERLGDRLLQRSVTQRLYASAVLPGFIGIKEKPSARRARTVKTLKSRQQRKKHVAWGLMSAIGICIVRSHNQFLFEVRKFLSVVHILTDLTAALCLLREIWDPYFGQSEPYAGSVEPRQLLASNRSSEETSAGS